MKRLAGIATALLFTFAALAAADPNAEPIVSPADSSIFCSFEIRSAAAIWSPPCASSGIAIRKNLLPAQVRSEIT